MTTRIFTAMVCLIALLMELCDPSTSFVRADVIPVGHLKLCASTEQQKPVPVAVNQGVGFLTKDESTPDDSDDGTNDGPFFVSHSAAPVQFTATFAPELPVQTLAVTPERFSGTALHSIFHPPVLS